MGNLARKTEFQADFENRQLPEFSGLSETFNFGILPVCRKISITAIRRFAGNVRFRQLPFYPAILANQPFAGLPIWRKFKFWQLADLPRKIAKEKR